MGAINCPVKNGPEWQRLLKQVGPQMANIVYIYHKQELPEIKTLTQTKTELKFKSRVEDFAPISRRIKKYNQKNRTAHYFTKNRIYGNTFELELHLIYLPVNIEKQRQRKESISRHYRVDNIDKKAFTELYPDNNVKDVQTNPVRPNRPFGMDGSMDRNIQTVDSEGNVVHPDNINDEDYLPTVKPGVQDLFENNNELFSIGTQKQYSDYLDTVFPNSKIKDIVYHGTNNIGFDNFSKELLGSNTNAPSAKKGFFFAGNKDASMEYFQEGKSRNYNTDDEYYDDLIGPNHKPLNDIESIDDHMSLYLSELHTDLFMSLEMARRKGSDQKEIDRINKFYANEIKNYENEIKNTRIKNTKIYSILLNSLNPSITDYNYSRKRVQTYASIIEEAQEKNKDSVILKNTYDPVLTDIYVMFEPEQIRILGSKEDVRGFKDFVKNTTVSTTADEDFLLPTASKNVTQVEKLRRKKLELDLSKTKDTLSKTTDPTTIKELLAKIEDLKRKIDVNNQNIIVSTNINTFEDILIFADSQLKDVTELLSKDTISAENILFAERVLNLWRKAGDFTTNENEHIILDEDEFNSPEIEDAFRLRAVNAETLERKLNKVREEHIIAFVRQYTNTNMSKEDIFKYLKDSGKLSSLVLNLGTHEDALLQTIYAAIESANIKAQMEAQTHWETFDRLTDKVLPKLKSMGNSNPWRAFEQTTDSGKGTGKLVHRFSTEFFEQINKLRYQAFSKKDAVTGKDKINKKEVEAYYDWLNKNTITFDARKLFTDEQLNAGHFDDKFLFTYSTFTDNDKANHIAELKQQLGEKGYEFYHSRLEKKFEKFKLDREVAWSNIEEKELSQGDKEQLFIDWNKENSPFWGSELIENPSMRLKPDAKSFYKANGVNNYSYQVPKKLIDNKKTKWYDSNFEKIENDSDLLEYYNNMLDTLKQMKSFLPKDKQSLMGITDIPKMKASLVDNFSEKGVMMGIKPLWDAFQKMKTTTDLSTIENRDVDPWDGQVDKSINVQFIEDTKQKVNAIVKTDVLQYRLENNGTDPSTEKLKEFRENARQKLSQDNSFDLTKIMKAYTLMALGYKHKSVIESHIKLVEKAFKNKEEIITNKAGIPKLNDLGEVETKKDGLVNMKSQLEHYTNAMYWGTGSRKVEGVSKTKAYTTEEKARLKELQSLIEKAVEEKDILHLQSEIDSLGGFVAGSAIGDMVLKFMTYRGLAYNVGSAFSNLGFGIISNIIQSSDGRNFTQPQMRKAYLLSINSIGKNLTLGKWEGLDQNALKIRTLMDKWDLLKTSNNEMYETSTKSTVKKGLGRFGPMSLQERTEYLNYAPVMIATMMNLKQAKDSEGNEVSMWDAMDVNGQLKEGFTSEFDEVKTILKIRRIIQLAHGDYSSSLQVKETITGRALSQFRTWMFEGFADRFREEKKDEILSYGNDEAYMNKGRYRSYTKGQLTTAGATLGTTILPGIGTALGAGAGFLVGKFFGMQTEQSGLSDTLFTLKQLARKLAFKKTQFDERGFSKVDSANMRKNMTELYILMGVAGVALMITAMGGDDDEEKAPAANFLLNQMSRMHTDIAFYSNPLEFEKLTKSSVPIMSLITDSKDWFVDVSKLYDEDSENDVFQSGPFKGMSKLMIQSGEVLPGSAQVIKTIRSSSQIY